MSRPFLAALNARIQEFGEDEFFGLIVDGMKPRELAEKFGCSRSYLYVWMNADKTGTRKARWDEARALAAHGMVEDVTEDIEALQRQGAAVTPAEVQVVNSKANHTKWLAGKYNREAYGDDKAALVQVNLGDAFLQALQAHGHVGAGAPAPLALPEHVEAEFEIESDVAPQSADDDPLAELLEG